MQTSMITGIMSILPWDCRANTIPPMITIPVKAPSTKVKRFLNTIDPSIDFILSVCFPHTGYGACLIFASFPEADQISKLWKTGSKGCACCMNYSLRVSWLTYFLIHSHFGSFCFMQIKTDQKKVQSALSLKILCQSGWIVSNRSRTGISFRLSIPFSSFQERLHHFFVFSV